MPSVGEQIGKYKILSALGAGGMGEVFLAEDIRLRRQVAVKVLPENLASDKESLLRFEQEAFAASALNHPNILTIYEFDCYNDIYFLATEYVKGETLRKRLRRGDLDLKEILDISIQIGSALETAHSIGIIHRDIKPENIMIRGDGLVKVLDFGLAKLIKEKVTEIDNEAETKALVKTNPGVIMGTVAYMSPEQARGKEIDIRTDIWSLGVILYEILAGRPPFQGETPSHTIVAILEKQPLGLEDVPTELQRIINKSLSKDKEMRYQTAKDLLIDLKKLQSSTNTFDDFNNEIIQKGLATTIVINDAAASEKVRIAAKTQENTNPNTLKESSNVSSLKYAITLNKSNKYPKLLIGFVLLIFLSIISYFGFLTNNSSKQIESLAVIPFINQSGNAEVDYLTDGMTETLINSLSQVPNLSVKARSSVFRYKGKEIDPKTVASELKVQAILIGTVIQRGNQITLSLELIDAANENLIWGNRYDRMSSNIAKLQSEIANDISSKLKNKLTGEEKAKVTKNYTENTEAYQLYLKGRFYWNKRTAKDFLQAIEFFNQAIEKDPNYALAYAGLADCYVLLPNYGAGSPQDFAPKAKAAARKALELDETLAEAHTSLGYALFNYDWNLAESNREFQRAIELNPNYATARQWYSDGNLLVMGQFEEAIAEIKRAQELDPLSLIINTEVGTNYIYARQPDNAIKQLQKTIEMDPNFYTAHWYLGVAYEMKGSFQEAIAAYQNARRLNDDPYILALLGHAYALSGRKDEALKLLDELKTVSKESYVSPYSFAIIYTGLGDKNQAFQSLEKSYQSRSSDMTVIKIDPLLDPLRDDSRLNDLINRVGL